MTSRGNHYLYFFSLKKELFTFQIYEAMNYKILFSSKIRGMNLISSLTICYYKRSVLKLSNLFLNDHWSRTCQDVQEIPGDNRKQELDTAALPGQGDCRPEGEAAMPTEQTEEPRRPPSVAPGGTGRKDE